MGRPRGNLPTLPTSGLDYKSAVVAGKAAARSRHCTEMAGSHVIASLLVDNSMKGTNLLSLGEETERNECMCVPVAEVGRVTIERSTIFFIPCI